MTVADPKDPKIQKWMKRLTPITVDPAKRDSYVQERLDDVRKAVNNVNNGSAPFDLMKPSDGIQRKVVGKQPRAS